MQLQRPMPLHDGASPYGTQHMSDTRSWSNADSPQPMDRAIRQSQSGSPLGTIGSPVARDTLRPASAFSPSRPATAPAGGSRPATGGSAYTQYSEIPARHKPYISDYTGHVPRLRQTFGMNSLKASDSLAHTISKPEVRTGNLQRLSYVQDGQRKLGLTRGTQLLGTGFTATAIASSHEKVEDQEADVYVQGTKVNLNSYYDTCEASGYTNLLIKAGYPGKNKSNVSFGDNYYYCGKHMYETTHKEAFRNITNDLMTGEVEPTEEEKKLLTKERIHSYCVAKAIVGTKRMDILQQQLSDKIQARVSGGIGLLRRMYAMFDRNGKGEVNPLEFHAVCMELGAKVTQTEALALFGRYDINGDGGMNYYEFLDAFLNEGPKTMNQQDRQKYY